VITESYLFFPYGVKAKLPKLCSAIHSKFRQLQKQHQQHRTFINRNDKRILSSNIRGKVQVSSTTIPGLSVTEYNTTSFPPLCVQPNDANDVIAKKTYDTNVVEESIVEHETLFKHASNKVGVSVTNTIAGAMALPCSRSNIMDTMTTTKAGLGHINNIFSNYNLKAIMFTAMQKDMKKSIFSSVGAGLTGFTDVLYKMRYGCFVNMMTGNTISLLRNVVEGGDGALLNAVFYASLIVAYIVGSMLTSVVCKPISQEKGSTQQPVAYQKCIQIVPAVLLLFVSADVIGTYFPSSHRRFGATALSMAYGLINTVSIEVTGGTILYAVTGHMNRVAKATTEIYSIFATARYKNKTENSDSSTANFDERKFTDNVYLISYHTRVVIGFAFGVVAGFRVLACMPEIAGQLSTDTAAFFTPNPSQCIIPSYLQKVLPINTIIGSLYAAILLWYGRYGTQRPTTKR
jgi:uncharacterized membrane protein YoaK (UPF0700 family)